MTEEESFLRAIPTEPNEDTVRLVYADWLEENRDRAGAVRAHFIRRQVAGEPVIVPLSVLVDVEELLGVQPHQTQQSASPGGCEVYAKGKLRLVYKKGFPLSVGGVRLADCFEQPQVRCVRCRNGRIRAPSMDGPNETQACEYCNGVGQVTGDWQPRPWLLRVLRHHATVERVPLVGKTPTTWSDTPAMWERDMTDTLGTTTSYICGETSRIPGLIFDAMAGKPGGYYFVVGKCGDKRYDTFELANDALAVAVVRVGREWVAKEEK